MKPNSQGDVVVTPYLYTFHIKVIILWIQKNIATKLGVSPEYLWKVKR